MYIFLRLNIIPIQKAVDLNLYIPASNCLIINIFKMSSFLAMPNELRSTRTYFFNIRYQTPILVFGHSNICDSNESGKLKE